VILSPWRSIILDATTKDFRGENIVKREISYIIMGNVCCGAGKESFKAGAFTVAGGSTSDSRSEIDGGSNNNKWDAAGDAASGGAQLIGGGAAGTSTGSSSNNDSSDPLSMMDQQQQLHQQSQIEENAATSSSAAAVANSANAAAAALLLRQEQARLEMIVQAAGRGMVAVRSTRGSNAYYDQGFAAALGQHLEQTTTFPQHVVSRQLPPFASGSGSSNSSTMTTVAATSSGATASSSLGDAASRTTNSSSSSSVYARLNQPAWEYMQLGTKKHGLAGCAGENPQAYFDHVAESFLDEIVPHKQRLFASNTVHPIVESLL
jgi:hypothetical protein